MSRLPSFVIIGAMKAATTTLYSQLRRQPARGIFLPDLKEPNFFGDDQQYRRGLNWYLGLFDGAEPDDILGEASTHYTKLISYPLVVERMRLCLAQTRLIYIMRDPIDRMISQYIHQWSEGQISCGIDEAITRHPELADYSFYARQLAPFIEAYGKRAILPVFFDRLKADPLGELERVCRFIGYTREVRWIPYVSHLNVSAERVRKFKFYDLIVEHPVATRLRRRVVPKAVRTTIRGWLSVGERPIVGERMRTDLEARFDQDLAVLGGWLGTELNCRNFSKVTAASVLNWK